MKNPNGNENQAIEPAVESTAIDPVVATPQHADSDSRGDSSVQQADGLSRRGFLRGSVATALCVALGVASPSKARADEINPTQDELEPVLRERLKGREIADEKMSMNEILIMDDAMQVLFKSLHHFSFWSNLTAARKVGEARKTMEDIMNPDNREKFWYKRKKNDVITIEKRGSGSPDAYIEIQYGKITRINNFTIDYKSPPVTDFDTEWADMEKQIKIISGKILTDIDYETGKPHRIADWEYDFYSQYSMYLPRVVLKSLELKGGLTATESKVKAELTRLLASHPKNMEEIMASAKEATETRDPTKRKKPTIIVLKRKAYKRFGMAETPDGVYEIARYGGTSGAWETFAYVSKDGRVMEVNKKKLLISDGKPVKSDNRARPFAYMSAKKTGLLQNAEAKFEQECNTELDSRRSDMARKCGAHTECTRTQFARFIRSCISDKIAGIFSGK
jgi:hypothetical protein